MLVPHESEIWIKSYGLTTRNLELFNKTNKQTNKLSIHSFKMLVPHASEIWIKAYGPTTRNFELFSKTKPKKKKKTKTKKQKKMGFFFVFLKPFWHSVGTIMENVSVTETIV